MQYTKKTTDQVKNNIILNIVNNVDEINDANIGSVLDFFVTGVSEELEEQYNDLDLIYKGTRIKTATGDDLEQIGLVVGTQRRQGVEADGFVTFRRTEPTTSSFTITRNSIVGTQPNAEENTYEYLVTENIVFPASISGESQEFSDGVYIYQLDQRFIDDVTQITGISSGSGVTFTEDTDYEVDYNYKDTLINIDTITIVEDCTDDTAWTESLGADAVTDNTTEVYYGASALNLLKSATDTTEMRYVSTITPTVSLSGKSIFFMLYIDDVDVLADVSSIKFYVGSSAGIINSFEYSYSQSDLNVGWNRIKLDPLSPLIKKNGNLDTGNVNFLQINITTSATNDIFNAGDLVMDMWFFATDYDYEGTVIKWNKDTAGNLPDDGTDFNINYVPLSMEVPVIANDVGAEYNVIAGRVNHKVTNIPNVDRIYNYNRISGGIDIEDDETYRDRIQNATFLQTNATVEAIRYSILALDFVRTVNILDMPEQTATNELHVYSSSTDKYALNHEVAQDDTNLKVGDTAGASDYVNGTDFILTEYNEIDWSVGGASPVDGANFYVDYKYEQLGRFTVYVVGADGALTSTQLAEVEEVVEDTRSAGVIGTVTEPTYTNVSVDITLTLETSYTIGLVEDEIELAIAEYFNTLGPGDDVVLNKIVEKVINIRGVYDCDVTDIGGGGSINYTISEAEVALMGTITLS